LGSISSHELTEWQALEKLEGPLYGTRREDLRAGVIAATVANVFRGKQDRALSPEDFVLVFSEVEEQTVEDQFAVLRAAAIAAKKRAEKEAARPNPSKVGG
jgi:hypothetical protein